MESGKLNRRLKIYSVTRVSDGVGGYTETPVLQKETWANVMPLSMRETLLYGMEVGVRAYKVTIRLDENYAIDQNYYFLYTDRFGNEKELRVVSVLDVEESGRTMTILANVRTD